MNDLQLDHAAAPFAVWRERFVIAALAFTTLLVRLFRAAVFAGFVGIVTTNFSQQVLDLTPASSSDTFDRTDHFPVTRIWRPIAC